MRKRLFSILQYVLFLGGGLFLVWWQLKEMTPADTKEFYHAFTYANYWLIIPIAIMCLASHLSRAMRWKLLMEQLGYKPALKNVFAVTIIGYLANAAIHRLGEILKCTFLSRYEKVKVDKLVGTILIERTFDIICYIIFIAITILIQIDVIGGYIKGKFSELATSSDIPLWVKFLILIALIASILFFLKYLFRKFPQNKVVLKIKNFFTGMAEGFKSINHLKKKKLFLAHTFFIWTMYLMQIYIGFHAIGGTSLLGFKAACSVLTMASLAMIITPGGIGSFPFLILETLIIYGIPKTIGKAFGFLIWGVSSGIIIVAGVICLVILPYINRKKHEISQEYTGENLQ